MRNRFLPALGLALLALPSTARAGDDTGAPAARTVFVEKGKGQRGLSILFEGDAISVRACEAECDAHGATLLRPPESARGLVSTGKVDTLRLAGGRRAALVRLRSDGDADREYDVLLVAPDAKSDAPRVLFSGWVTANGAEGRGDRSTKLELRVDGEVTDVRLTTRASLCGADVTTQLRALDPKKLVLTDTPAPDPIGGSRVSAREVTASLDPSPTRRHRVLRARVASSGRPAAVTDGDPATSWTEDDTGVPAHPFVTLDAAADVSVEGLDLTFAAPTTVAGARAPKKVTLVTDAGSFVVTLPEDAVAKGGATFAVKLPSPIVTRCVGVVVDEVFSSKDSAEPAVYLSEVAARTALDNESLAELAKGLAGESADPLVKVRESILIAERDAGARAAIAAYAGLDGPGRDRARRVIDPASCELKLALYVPLLIDPDHDESDRARDRIRRCGKDAAAPLLAAFGAATDPAARQTFAEEAAILAPRETIPKLVAGLSAATSAPERRLYRRALAKGMVRGAGTTAMNAFLSSSDAQALSLTARIDVLRALGASIGDVESAAPLFAKSAADATEFRDRYLLLGPAGELAKKGDSDAIHFVEAAISDENHRLRARAAEVSAGVDALRPRLLVAIDDERVRVREAALGALVSTGAAPDAALANKLVDRLAKDPWTFVRRAAASALAVAPADPAIDARIAEAMELEPMPAVRADILAALGARHATTQATHIAARAFDAKEDPTVRLAAIDALGLVCAKDSIDALTALVKQASTPVFESDRKLGGAAIGALGRIRPADLKARLAPVLDEHAPSDMRDIARRSLDESAAPSTCR
ncbi:MAG: HEAT repeat domain-containing protein [Polyangiaceae bacterium]